MADPDVTAIFFIRQWLLMAKKLEVACSEDRVEATLTGYLEIDSRLPDHHPDTWDQDDPIWIRRLGHPLWGRPQPLAQSDFGFPKSDLADDVDWALYRSICDRLRSSIGVFDPWSARPKHGRGAVADVKPGLKYEFKNWPRKLQQLFPWDYFASPDLGYYRCDSGTEPNEVEYPSVVLCVPKTQKGPRIICKEPIAHQWMQGAIERFLVKRFNETAIGISINIQNQVLSQNAAMDASACGETSTVDLSNASDRISTRLVEYLFNGGGSDTSILDALHATRSRLYIMPDGTMHKFRKFAPAGSACTFPVQSLLFLSLAILAVCQTRGLGAQDWIRVLPQIRVYGDDIIIPTDAIPVLYRVLETCGLKVNKSKSYTTGFFRESCGMDAYLGQDVTPAYVVHLYSVSNPESLQATVDSANNLFMKGLWHTSEALLKTVPVKERKLIPVRAMSPDLVTGGKATGSVSLASYCGDSVSHLSLRFNDYYHRWESRCIVLRQKQDVAVSDGDAGLIQFFSEEPDPLNHYSSGEVQRVRGMKTTGWV